MICDAFDAAWAELQRTDEALADPGRSAITRTILAKRIIEMAHREDMNATQLRDDAIAHVRNNPTAPWRLT
jgi:hypothetical protein